MSGQDHRVKVLGSSLVKKTNSLLCLVLFIYFSVLSPGQAICIDKTLQTYTLQAMDDCQCCETEVPKSKKSLSTSKVKLIGHCNCIDASIQSNFTIPQETEGMGLNYQEIEKTSCILNKSLLDSKSSINCLKCNLPPPPWKDVFLGSLKTVQMQI